MSGMCFQCGHDLCRCGEASGSSSKLVPNDQSEEKETIASLRARLLTLLEKWRAEALAEQRVSFCADELEAVLASSRGRAE